MGQSVQTKLPKSSISLVSFLSTKQEALGAVGQPETCREPSEDRSWATAEP